MIASAVHVDPDQLRVLLHAQAARFCRARLPAEALRRGVTPADAAALRDLLVAAGSEASADGRSGEAALFAAIALASVGDPSGLPLLRDPGRWFTTNSCVEVALCRCARLALGDLAAPLSFINASMLGALAELVGARPDQPW